jgi:hypothetical protein
MENNKTEGVPLMTIADIERRLAEITAADDDPRVVRQLENALWADHQRSLADEPPASGDDNVFPLPDSAVVVEDALARRARFVASRTGISLAEYLSDLIRGTVNEDFRQVLREMGVED